MPQGEKDFSWGGNKMVAPTMFLQETTSRMFNKNV